MMRENTGATDRLGERWGKSNNGKNEKPGGNRNQGG